MTFCLLSCTENLDPKLSHALAKEIKDRGAKVAYISSSPQEEPYAWYQSTIADYTAIDASIQVDYFDLSARFSDAKLQSLNEYRVIYLSGGNTFVFMNDARKRNLYPILKHVADAGGLLIGASAGSLMLSPSIESASDEDENSVGMTDFTGFSFVDCEFYPHWVSSESQRAFLDGYKKRHDATIYTCEDGGGIFLEGSSILTFGNITKYV